MPSRDSKGTKARHCTRKARGQGLVRAGVIYIDGRRGEGGHLSHGRAVTCGERNEGTAGFGPMGRVLLWG